MSYVWVRRATLAGRTATEASEWAVKVGRLSSIVGRKEFAVLFPVSGDLRTVLWTGNVADLAEFERILGQIAANPEYQTLVEEARSKEFLTAVTDTIYRMAE